MEYRVSFPMFEGTHEEKFIISLCDALNSGDFYRFHNLKPFLELSPWHTDLLRRIEVQAVYSIYTNYSISEDECL